MNNLDRSIQSDSEHTICVRCPECQGYGKDPMRSSKISYVKCKECDGLGCWWERPKLPNKNVVAQLNSPQESMITDVSVEVFDRGYWRGWVACKNMMEAQNKTQETVYPEKTRPWIVCLCGSTKFKQAFIDANRRETLKGSIVLSVGLFGHSDEQAIFEIVDENKMMLDELHKRKIDLADEILVLNVGGYIGESTRSEIRYAREHGKMIRFLEAASLEDARS